jgi:hypothetical protein
MVLAEVVEALEWKEERRKKKEERGQRPYISCLALQFLNKIL